MLHPVCALLLATLIWAAALIPSVPARAQTDVDLALVIAVDISYSMDTDEQELQREGFAEAFRSPLVHDAIRHGMLGRVAVTYMEWAGSADQHVIISWTILDNSESLMAFADRIASTPLAAGATHVGLAARSTQPRTCSSSSGLEATRKVIDVSGDGANNQGRPVAQPSVTRPLRAASRSTACRSC